MHVTESKGVTSKDEWTAKEGEHGVIGHSETVWKQTGGLSSIDDESDDVWQITKENITWWYEDQQAAADGHAGGKPDE